MYIIKDKMQELRRLKDYVNNAVFSEDETFEKALKLFSNFLDCEEHIDIYNFSIVHYFSSGQLEKAKEIVDKAILKFPFNFDLNTNAFAVYKELGNMEKAIEFYCKRYASDIDINPKHKSEYLKEIEEFLMEMLKEGIISKDETISLLKNSALLLNETAHHHFPLETTGSYIRKNIAEGRDIKKYFVNLYKTLNATDVVEKNHFLFKTEILHGDFFNSCTTIDNKKSDIFCISPVDKSLNVKIKQNDKVLRDTKISINDYKYFSLPIDGKLNIETDGDCFLSQIKNNNNEKKPKLVIYIALDGLSQRFLDEKGFKNLMPKTSDFFEKGYINKSCYSSTDWTMPSFASVATGKYTLNHNLYHPRINYNFESINKMVQEYFNENGYVTTKICNNRRVTPNLGYYKGFNRTVYQDNKYGLNGFEIIGECIEHIETFKYFNNYIELMFMDVHDVTYGEEHTGHLSERAYDSIEATPSNGDITKDEFREYNKNKGIIYENEIKRIDVILSTLYMYVQENYKDDEFVICINSDHGHSFLEKGLPFMYENKVEKHLSFLHEWRNKVAFMIRGKDVPSMKSYKLMENIDVMPTLLKACNIDFNDEIDGWVIEDFGGEKKRYTYAEVYHPLRLYRAVITDETHTFYFDTEDIITNDGVVDIDNYKVNIVNRKTEEIENESQQEKIAYYINVVFDHIKSRIRI